MLFLMQPSIMKQHTFSYSFNRMHKIWLQPDRPRVLQTEGPIDRGSDSPRVRQTEGPLDRGSVRPRVRQTEGPIDRGSVRPSVRQTEGPIDRGSVRPRVLQTEGPIDRLLCLKYINCRICCIFLFNNRSIGPSVYRIFGLSDPFYNRSIGPSV